MEENKQCAQKVVLIAVDTGDNDCEKSLAELESLCNTAGGEVEGIFSQCLDIPSSHSYIGSGKLEELKEFCDNNEIDLIIADDELSPKQQKTIENETKVSVIDRTGLILDIFAFRARSREGKLQVALAQYQYLLPRLIGKGTAMSRLGGGIGTRGPGETKLESDKRHIRRQITFLKREIELIQSRRNNLRKNRAKRRTLTVALVGYTNAGKSTLMNTLTGAGVLAENKLFATLDPTARGLKLPNGSQVMLIDTVGFIRRLPTELVESFKSTLEEAANADLILNVCDCSDCDFPEHIQVTRDILTKLTDELPPIITVLNKADLVTDKALLIGLENSISISALDGTGIDTLLTKIQDILPQSHTRATLLIPYKEYRLINSIMESGKVFEMEHKENGVFVDALIDNTLYNSVGEYLVP